MRRIIITFSIIISVFVVCGANQCDSINVFTSLSNEIYNPAHDNDLTSVANPVDDIVAPVYSDSQTIKPIHRLAVKTNLLYDAALLPNLELEWRINNHWSLALEGGVAWWGKYSGKKSYRLAMLSPEVKRWFLNRGPWHGLYVGLFGGAGLYDFEKPSKGYRGEGVMGGLSVGYMWPVSRCLSLEAAIGGGYLYTRYKEYTPIGDHHVYQRTKNLNYFGPLKVKFSLVWRLWNINKPNHVNLSQQRLSNAI